MTPILIALSNLGKDDRNRSHTICKVFVNERLLPYLLLPPLRLACCRYRLDKFSLLCRQAKKKVLVFFCDLRPW